MQRHRDLIDAEANAINIADARGFRTEQMEHSKRWRMDRVVEVDRRERRYIDSCKREAFAWLGATEPDADILFRLLRSCSHVHWALAEPTITSWLDNGRDNPRVWVNGKPGAGESYHIILNFVTLKSIRQKHFMFEDN